MAPGGGGAAIKIFSEMRPSEAKPKMLHRVGAKKKLFPEINVGKIYHE